MTIAKELAYTLMNELNNQRDWEFEGKRVTSAEVNEEEEACVVLIGLEGDVDVALTVEVIE